VGPAELARMPYLEACLKIRAGPGRGSVFLSALPPAWHRCLCRAYCQRSPRWHSWRPVSDEAACLCRSSVSDVVRVCELGSNLHLHELGSIWRMSMAPVSPRPCLAWVFCDRPSAHAQEGLRLYPPAVFAAVREATENVEVCGHVIPRGAWLHVRSPAAPG